MFVLDLLFAFVIGSAIAWVWSKAFNTHGPWNSFFWSGVRIATNCSASSAASPFL